MSYSFSFRAATKAEASEKVAEELAKVVSSQPVHEVDRAQAQAAVDSFINLLRDDEDQEISVSVSGSCWSVAEGLNSAGCNVTASLVAKQAG